MHLKLPVNTLENDLNAFFKNARPRKLRTMRQFAEQEIVIPTGPYAGLKFNCARQPFTGEWFDQLDSGHWTRHVATGPSQSGKTLACFHVPLLYHLFEQGEGVVCALPDMDMAADKWRQDIFPVIERSRYRELLPRKGGASRGGRVESIQFANGATLKFMSGGGSDKSRAGYTTRVVVATEIDGLDVQGGTSREADKLTQIEARTNAFGKNKRVYFECTVSTEGGRTWQEYTQGSKSRLVLPCPHCHQWVLPEREQLTGWQGASTEQAAREAGAFVCPNCGVSWTEDDRVRANKGLVVLHDGQTITPEGKVEGPMPQTQTLGFRWSAVHNLFVGAGELAAGEWKASRAQDEDNAERARRQFTWAVPVVPAKMSEFNVQTHELVNRVIDLPRGIVPKDAVALSAGIDLGKFLCHWVVVAWSPGAVGHVVDYGRTEVASESLGIEPALMVALREFRGTVLEGFPLGSAEGERVKPACVCVDAGYMTPVVYAFVKESGPVFRPAIGRGATQQREQWAQRTTQTGSKVLAVGDGCHSVHLEAENLVLFQADSDYWKTWVHQRLTTPVGRPGAMTLFKATPQEHLALAKHLTAEKRTEEFIAGKGVVSRWERISRNNHWFDALYNACLAGYACGVKLIEGQPAEQPSAPPPADEGRIDLRRWREGHRRW